MNKSLKSFVRLVTDPGIIEVAIAVMPLMIVTGILIDQMFVR